MKAVAVISMLAMIAGGTSFGVTKMNIDNGPHYTPSLYAPVNVDETPAPKTIGAPVQLEAKNYNEAYTECEAYGWDESTVNQCRWGAFIHFGGNRLLSTKDSTDA